MMLYIKLILTYIVLTIFIFSCTPTYSKYAPAYKFTHVSTLPDYTNLDYWAAHPWKKDLSDSVPADLKNEKRDSLVDVFFIHPTTYTGEIKTNNAAINDSILNAKTDYTTILYQSTVFNQHARIFSPRYRQMHLSLFYLSDDVRKPAFDTAYEDVKRAFDLYLKLYHQDRPIIIAGHSQGALLAERLLKEYFDGKPLQQKLVAAYIIGWPVAPTFFMSLPVCKTPEQTGCFCSWRTFRKEFTPDYVAKENFTAAITNPISWTTTTDYVSRQKNTGSVLKNFNKLIKATTDAQIHEGILWVNKPKFKGSIFFSTKTYHVVDVNLFWMNVRQNVEQRIQAFQKK